MPKHDATDHLLYSAYGFKVDVFFLAKIHELMFYFVVGKIVSHLGWTLCALVHARAFPPPLKWKGHLCRPTPSLTAAAPDFPVSSKRWIWKKSCRNKTGTPRQIMWQPAQVSIRAHYFCLIELALISSETSCSGFLWRSHLRRFIY